jgi:putative DNA primase/helicase
MNAIPIHSLARALGGEVAGRNSILAPGPGHSRSDRSLSITLDTGAPEGFLVNSFAGDDPIACRDHVRALAGFPAWSPRQNEARPSVPRVFAPQPPDPDEGRKAAWLQARVRELWEGASDPRGTVVEAYLASRALILTPEVAGLALRFHPSCPWKDNDGSLIRVQAMVAAMSCIYSDKLKAVHRTRLTPEGHKIDRRMLGDAAETAIKLDPDEAVTTGLTIGEGIETTLAARQLGFRPAWALGSVGAMSGFPVMPGVEVLTLLAEEDKTGANAKAINACGLRWHKAGRGVIEAVPRFGGDMNDAIRGGLRHD